jgi:pyruvate dehydrogenase (quinone)
MTAADVLVETLLDWGVDNGINGIMEALRTRQDKIRFIQVRHEESAAFMACAYAKFTGRLGVCLATSGPGGIHMLNGLYDAKMDGQPVLALTGLQFHNLIGTYTQQDVALDRLYMEVATYKRTNYGQEEVSRHIADMLRLKITNEQRQRISKKYTDNAEAYQLYLKGRHYQMKDTPET